MRGKDVPIDEGVRRLARAIMRGVLSRYRKPSWSNLNPWLDARTVTLGNATSAHHAPLWLEVSTLDRAKTKTGKSGTAYATVALPVGDYAFWRARDAAGKRATTVQVIDRGDRLLVTDMEEPFAASRAAYVPLSEELALDFGLVTMFATADGDLLGRAWFGQLKRHDARIAGHASSRSRGSSRTARAATATASRRSAASSRPRSAGC